MLLLSQYGKHFLWVGSDAEIEGRFVHDEAAESSDLYLRGWAASVGKGEVNFDQLIGKNLLKNDVRIERSFSNLKLILQQKFEILS